METHTRVKGQAGSPLLSKLGGTTAGSVGGQVLNDHRGSEAQKEFIVCTRIMLNRK